MRFFGRIELNRGDAVWLVGLVIASVLLYAQTLDFAFVHFDDQTILVEHPARYDESSLANSVRKIFVEDFPREEPLVIRDLSWALDSRLFGFDNAGAYHRTNVALNALVVALLFVFLRRLRLSTVLAGGVACVFALLPIHMEVVAWVMGRKDLLVAIFILLGLLAQHAELESTTSRSKALFYAMALACLILALGSKISAISFWLVLAAHRFFYPYLCGSRQPNEAIEWKPDAMRTLPPLVPHLILSLIVFAWYRARLSEFGIIQTAGPGPLDPEHLLNMLTFLPLIAAEYLQHLFMPGELSSYYRWPHVAIPLTGFQRAASLGWAIGVLGAVAYCLRRRRDLAFYLLMTLGLLAPYIGFFYVGFWYADRYLYLASAGLLTVLAILTGELVAQRPPFKIPAIAIVGLFSVLNGLHVWQGQNRWQDDESLWLYESSRSDPALLSFQALARHYVEEAEAAPPERQRELALMSKVISDRGLALRSRLDLHATTYPIPEKLQTARLHALAGRADVLLGAPPLMRAAHYRRAFSEAPERLSAILLSGALYEASQALPAAERQPLVEESFDYFLEFVELSSVDPAQLATSQVLLDKNYGDRFPYLTARIAEAKRTYFP